MNIPIDPNLSNVFTDAMLFITEYKNALATIVSLGILVHFGIGEILKSMGIRS